MPNEKYSQNFIRPVAKDMVLNLIEYRYGLMVRKRARGKFVKNQICKVSICSGCKFDYNNQNLTPMAVDPNAPLTRLADFSPR